VRKVSPPILLPLSTRPVSTFFKIYFPILKMFVNGLLKGVFSLLSFLGDLRLSTGISLGIAGQAGSNIGSISRIYPTPN
jgi:hypothetical protein